MPAVYTSSYPCPCSRRAPAGCLRPGSAIIAAVSIDPPCECLAPGKEGRAPTKCRRLGRAHTHRPSSAAAAAHKKPPVRASSLQLVNHDPRPRPRLPPPVSPGLLLVKSPARPVRPFPRACVQASALQRLKEGLTPRPHRTTRPTDLAHLHRPSLSFPSQPMLPLSAFPRLAASSKVALVRPTLARPISKFIEVRRPSAWPRCLPRWLLLCSCQLASCPPPPGLTSSSCLPVPTRLPFVAFAAADTDNDAPEPAQGRDQRRRRPHPVGRRHGRGRLAVRGR